MTTRDELVEVLVTHGWRDNYDDGKYVGYICACRAPDSGPFDSDLCAHLADMLLPLIEAEKAAALEEVAIKWQTGGWSILTPKPEPPAIPSIALGNRVTDWLRDRAAEYRRAE